jgi:energy-coupling factor transport system permease protein
MQDVRIRLLSAAVLSLVAFFSIPGALAAFAWWLIFTPRIALLKRLRMALFVFLMIAFFALVLEMTGGNGLSYFVRMGVIVFVGIWVLSEQKPGELLGLAVWLFGNRKGFELGMIAEMGMQSFSLLLADFTRIRMAEKLKNEQNTYASLVPSGRILLRGALNRAESTAELLAVRGFSGGGSLCPEFTTARGDIAAGFCTLLCAGAVLVVPVSEFFILS